MPLSDRVKSFKPTPKPDGPVWAGPESPSDNGGVTFSLLNRFLACRERFKAYVIDGWKGSDRWNHKIQYGQMWHECEEAHRAGKSWETALLSYCKELTKQYPFEQSEIQHWCNVAQVQFPVYLTYWSNTPELRPAENLLREEVFRSQHKLPSGRIIYLKGKWDSVDQTTSDQGEAILRLEDHKTKARVDPAQISRNLTFDLQTMLYFVALLDHLDDSFWRRANKRYRDIPARVVRYNVVRRTEHRVGKKEGEDGFCQRLRGIMEENPGEWFMRWDTEISRQDVRRFEDKCLNPILEQLCHWYNSVTGKPTPVLPPWAASWQTPYGIYNPTTEGLATDYDNYLATGSTVGLTRVTELFPELKA